MVVMHKIGDIVGKYLWKVGAEATYVAVAIKCFWLTTTSMHHKS